MSLLVGGGLLWLLRKRGWGIFVGGVQFLLKLDERVVLLRDGVLLPEDSYTVQKRLISWKDNPSSDFTRNWPGRGVLKHISIA